MPDSIDRDVRPPTVQTGIWIAEHGWLHRLFKSADNTSPKFRFRDLLGACASLAFRDLQSHRHLAAPGMPLGSPGMDGPAYGGQRTAHDVLLVRQDGSASVYQSYR